MLLLLLLLLVSSHNVSPASQLVANIKVQFNYNSMMTKRPVSVF